MQGTNPSSGLPLSAALRKRGGHPLAIPRNHAFVSPRYRAPLLAGAIPHVSRRQAHGPGVPPRPARPLKQPRRRPRPSGVEAVKAGRGDDAEQVAGGLGVIVASDEERRLSADREPLFILPMLANAPSCTTRCWRLYGHDAGAQGDDPRAARAAIRGGGARVCAGRIPRRGAGAYR
jgi:hypothetical protein